MDSPKTGAILGAVNAIAIVGVSLYFMQRCNALASELLAQQKEFDEWKKKTLSEHTALAEKLANVLQGTNNYVSTKEPKFKLLDKLAATVKKLSNASTAKKHHDVEDDDDEPDAEDPKKSSRDDDDDEEDDEDIKAAIAAAMRKRKDNKKKDNKKDNKKTSVPQKKDDDDDDDDISAAVNAAKGTSQ